MNFSRGSDHLLPTDREVTREQRVLASRAVLRHALSREDLHDLCEALGLNAPSRAPDSDPPPATDLLPNGES
ncbi:hypothetical protein [Streptomyces sp. NPDC056160]|uniref:hypothetical protein n=1 Tax=Streptomyces sp. NPDC056160 TaxID=3345731 RepID=UPI0035DEC1EC